jgi:hypothetical protein
MTDTTKTAEESMNKHIERINAGESKEYLDPRDCISIQKFHSNNLVRFR